ncbi:MAG: zinc metallopeptidase, partial [Fibrobacterota bacterium]
MKSTVAKFSRIRASSGLSGAQAAAEILRRAGINDVKVERVDGKPKDPPRPISRRNFVDLCDVVVKEDEQVFKSLWTRMGMSYDW